MLDRLWDVLASIGKEREGWHADEEGE
jgi:hypothetical protein